MVQEVATTKTLTTAQQAAVGAFTGVMTAVLIVCAIAYYVLLVIAWWKLFTKAGEKGWKAIIPFYNMFIQYKLTWSKKFFWIVLVLAILSGVFQTVTVSITGAGQVICSLLSLAASIALLVLMIIADYRLSKAYGHGGGFTVGLVFLNFIFMLVLGFGKSEYQGNVYLKEKEAKSK